VSSTVAVLGTGIMGAAMARNLAAAGLRTRAWNRTPARAAPLADSGVEVTDTAVKAVDGADVVVTMLQDTAAVLDTVGTAVDGLAGHDRHDDGAVWLQMSTIGLDGTRAAATLAERSGLRLVDAPVLGTRQPAEQGTLVVVASGDPSLRERVEPVLEAVGRRTLWVGDRPGPASALKLVVNSWVATLNAGLAQALAMAEHLDLDPDLFLGAIEGGPTDTPYAHVKGALMTGRDYPTAFALDSVLKDLDLMRAAADGAGMPHRLLDTLRELYGDASAAGHGGLDMAAVREAF
jgi:3-hydroxyisobutyrate dehydrogenase